MSTTSSSATDGGVVGRYRWVICGMLFAATAINYIDRQILGVLKPTLQLEYGWTETAFANVVLSPRMEAVRLGACLT